LIGQKVAGYRVEALIGEGGMGSVYSVRHLRLPNTVAALKVLKTTSDASTEVSQRFVQEALVAAAIGSHRVAKPLDLGRLNDGTPFILMELVHGRTLAQRLASGALPARSALIISYRIADTMEVAHRRGIIHRDLKPSNIMLLGAAEESVKLLDFGIAHAPEDLRFAETRERTVLGSPGYMSPEALLGEKVGPETDVFSLGVVMREMAWGTLSDKPGADSQRGPHLDPLPPAFESLTQRMLDRDPSTRPSMSDVKAALETIIASLSPDLLPSRSVEEPAEPPADQRATTLTLRPGESSLAPLRARAERFASTRLHPRGRVRSVAAIGIICGVILAALLITRRTTPSTTDRPPTHLTQRALTFEGSAQSWGLSPDGKTLAFADSGRIVLLDLASGKERTVATVDGVVASNWSSDSRQLKMEVVTNGSQRLYAIDRETGKASDLGRGLPGISSPISGDVAYADGSWDHIQVKFADGKSRRLALPGPNDEWYLDDWSRDTQELLVRERRGAFTTIGTISIADGRYREITRTTMRVPTANFVQGGRAIVWVEDASSDEIGDLRYQRTDGGTPVTIASGFYAPDLSISRDGKLAAYTHVRLANEIWLATLPDASSNAPVITKKVLGDTSPKRYATLSPDGRAIAYLAGDGVRTGLFTTPADHAEPRRIVDPSVGVSSVAWSLDSMQLAYVTEGNALWIVDRDGGNARQIALSVLGNINPSPELCWAPSREIWVSLAEHKGLARIDPTSGAVHVVRQEKGAYWFSLLPSPDGRWVAAYYNHGPSDRGLAITSTDGAAFRLLVKTSMPSPLAWSIDSNRIRFLDPSTTDLREVSLEGGDAYSLGQAHLDDAAAVSSATDGHELAYFKGGGTDVWVIENFDQLLPPL
jgi:serine/threonine protein kinase/Tol biopolymer transport system component